MDLKVGTRCLIRTRAGGPQLAVRITSEPKRVQYGEVRWVGFMAYRIRRNEPSVSYGYERGYLAIESEVAELPEGPKPTPAQQRILDRVADGPRKFNGRAAKSVERLESLGLVTADWDLSIGGDHDTRWIITVTKAEE